MIDSTNPRILADNIRALKDACESQATNVSILQTTVAAQGAIVEGLKTYDDEETDTGKIWIDGKKIYRRVLTGTTGDTLNAITTAISTASMGFDNVISMDAYIKSGDYYSPMGSGFVAYYLYGSSAIAPGIRCKVTSEAYLSSDIIVIIEYTKSAELTPDVLPSPDPDTRSLKEVEPEPEPIEEKK